MLTLTLCMIVKNEQDNLERCLASCHPLFDEIIIVDTGSTDATVRVAARYTDGLYYFKWVNDFSAARNFSFSKATRDYIMWLDADDVISPEDGEKIARLKAALPPGTDVVKMVYNYSYHADGTVALRGTRDRLVRRRARLRWAGRIHETISATTAHRFLTTDIAVNHRHKSAQDADASLKRNMAILQDAMASEQPPTLSTLMHYITALHGLRRYDECITWGEVLIKRADAENTGYSFANIFILLHGIYKERNDMAAAAALLTQNQARMADKSEYYCLLGDYYKNTRQDLPLAWEHYARALACTGKEPSGDYESRYDAYYYYVPHMQLAYICVALDRYKEALGHVQKARTYSPDDPQAQALYAKVKRLAELTGG